MGRVRGGAKAQAWRPERRGPAVSAGRYRRAVVARLFLSPTLTHLLTKIVLESLSLLILAIL